MGVGGDCARHASKHYNSWHDTTTNKEHTTLTIRRMRKVSFQVAARDKLAGPCLTLQRVAANTLSHQQHSPQELCLSSQAKT
jgi:hypothetical protein